MTPGEVRVTVARVCPDCNGRGNQYSDCCHGEGVVWEPVSCAGCEHLKRDDNPLIGTCDALEIDVLSWFACVRWKPIEPRS